MEDRGPSRGTHPSLCDEEEPLAWPIHGDIDTS